MSAGTDEPVDRASLLQAARLTMAAHDCEPGMVRQRQCHRCTDGGCDMLDWAQRTHVELGAGRGSAMTPAELRRWRAGYYLILAVLMVSLVIGFGR